MASMADKIYVIMPVCIQSLMMGAKGWSLNRKRYGKRFHWYLDNLMRTQWFSAQQFHDLQVTELRKLVKEVSEHVPYYREKLSRFAGRIDKMSLEDLKELPFLDTSALRTNTKHFLNRQRLRYGHEQGHTSGSSGSPLVWPYDMDSMNLNLAFRARQYRWAGLTGKEKSARFSGRLIMGKHDSEPYWRYNLAEKQWFFSVYHLTDENLPAYYRALRRFDVAYVDGYPSVLFTMAKWINMEGKSGLFRPWAVFTTGETLMSFQRNEIERAFGCRVPNFYSSAEGAPFITQCESGSMHLNPESGIIDFLRRDGTCAEPEEDAEIVITSFFQRTMPLIRYRIGDTGALAANQTCACGRQMPVVKYIEGRECDVLYSTEKGRIGSAGLSTALYKIPFRVRESQIEQTGVDSFIFRYVSNGKALDTKESKVILDELRSRLGNSVRIEITEVDSIRKGPAGKSRLLISLKKNEKSCQ
jgi:phenylacetate-CoA ligase